MLKKFIIGFLVLLVGIFIWFQFLQSYDVKAKFETTAHPGSVIQMLKTWTGVLPSARVTETDSISGLNQEIAFNDSKYKFEWNVDAVNDSTTSIQVYLTDEAGSALDRLNVLFAETKIEQDGKILINQFREVLNSHLKRTKVSIQGISKMDSTFCVCTPQKSTQQGKAYAMMRSYGELTSFVDNNAKENGFPIIEVTNWNMSEDLLEFNFCYPIVKTDSLREVNGLEYKWIGERESIKGIYNGNYITSDRAWFELLEYAESNNIKTERLPIEVFHDNPNFGGNELDWKAEIFLPIKTEEP